MKVKTGADLSHLRGQLWYAAGVAETLFRNRGAEFTITSGNDGQHLPNSFHYRDLAIDCRTRHLTSEQRNLLFLELQTALNPLGFDVILEILPPHFHIEFDPKPGERFITEVA